MRILLAILMILLASLAGCASEDPGDHAGDHSDDEDSASSDSTSTSNDMTGGNETGNGTTTPTEFTFSYNVTGEFAPVVANFTVDATGGYESAFATLTIDFGDGSTAAEFFEPTFPLTVEHTYEAAGEYAPSAILQEDQKAPQKQDLTLTVVEKPPRDIPANQTFGNTLGCVGDQGPDECILLIESGAPVGAKFILGPEHWLLNFEVITTGAVGDSDCSIVDAGGVVLSSPNGGSGACAGSIPELAAAIYVWEYATPALDMTITFFE